MGTALLLVWINLAVGIIGSEDNPVNLLYFWVLFIGIIGATIARLRPQGMARALFVTAFAQALVPVIVLIIGESPARSMQEPPGVSGVLLLNAFFAILFTVLALRPPCQRQDKNRTEGRCSALGRVVIFQ